MEMKNFKILEDNQSGECSELQIPSVVHSTSEPDLVACLLAPTRSAS